MAAIKVFAVVLIALGILGLLYGSFSYTKERHTAKIGSMEISVKEKETINVPLWAGVAAVVAGTAILLAGGKKP